MEKTIDVVIGVDVGGTNTDAVILQTNIKPPRVLSSAKSTTTRDVTSGIRTAISLAISSRNQEQKVSLQRINIGTTHFVNAVVQRKGLTKVTVIRLCGTASRSLPPFSDFPSDLNGYINGGTYFVCGGYQVDGREISSVDKEEILRVVAESYGKGVTNFVICGLYCSIKNDQEILVKKIIEKEFPDASITMSHDIGKDGLIERENASILNESLKPLCRNTIYGFRNVLSSMELSCPLYLTQNDGTVVSAEFALERPVCTFASGPTNSMRGAAFLSGIREAVVIDIGGTTTDIGILRKGFPREASTEIKIGGVITNFRMPDVYSIGLGGGSYISQEMHDDFLSVKVGPRSAGYNLQKEAFVFQENLQSCKMEYLTATDLAVAAGHVVVGKSENISNLPITLVDKGIKKIKSMIEIAIDSVKLSADPLPAVLVGGGGIILNPKEGLDGTSELIFPKNFEVANAVGAALSQISGTVDYVVNLAHDFDDETVTHLAMLNDKYTNIEETKKHIRKDLYEKARLEALEKAVKSAIEKTVNAGADVETVKVLDKSDTPLSYLPGNATKIYCKAVGDVITSTEPPVIIGRDFLITESDNKNNQEQPSTESAENVYTCQKDEIETVQGKPFINGNNEWILSEYDIECIGIGAGILGCGGGGSPYIGKILAKRAVKEGKHIKIVNPYNFFSDKSSTDDLVVETAFMGAPSVVAEKAVSGELVIALNCMRDLYLNGHQDADLCIKDGIELKTENGVTFIEDYVPRASRDVSAGDGLDDNKKIVGLMCAEIGGLNAMEPLIVGAELGFPVLDCDGMGRAFPELQMFSPLIYGVNPYPATLADDKGRRAVVLHADSAKDLENHFRRTVVEMGCNGGFILSAMNKEDILSKTILFSMSRAWRLGDAIMSSRRSKQDPVETVLRQEGGLRLISGKITDVRRETTGGFNKGFVDIAGIERFAGKHIFIEFQNENLVARSKTDTSSSLEVVACTPDLITIVDDDTAEPITTETVRYGLRVSVLVLPVPDIMKTSTALKVVGPAAFGYSDVQFNPVAKYKEPTPIVQ